MRHCGLEVSIPYVNEEISEKKEKMSFYYDMWVHSNLTFRKCWKGPNAKAVINTLNANNRFISVNAESEYGFLPGAQLLHKASTASGD
jgi:hypothetical protein